MTVLSSDDPIRVFQRFSTVDALSNGRAEVILGRGSFIESFPLFGYDLGDYEDLFTEKLDLFATLLHEEPVVWSGRTRAPLRVNACSPPRRPGCVPGSASGAAPSRSCGRRSTGFPLVIAIIGGPAERFAPFAELYRRALGEMDRDVLPIAVHSPGHIADSDDEAKEQAWPHYRTMHDRIGAERGWGPTNRVQFEAQVGPHGSLYVGSPETVARKIVTTARMLDLSRFDLKYSMGQLPHVHMMRSIELYGTKVIPLVRDMMA